MVVDVLGRASLGGESSESQVYSLVLQGAQCWLQSLPNTTDILVILGILSALLPTVAYNAPLQQLGLHVKIDDQYMHMRHLSTPLMHAALAAIAVSAPSVPPRTPPASSHP